MKVAVIGHRNVKITKEAEEIIYTQIETLIIKGADSFCFAFKGAFTDACYNAVTALKKKYRINRVFYYSEENVLAPFCKERYDVEVKTNKCCYYKSINKFMIDECDVLLTFYDQNYVPYSSKVGKSGTYYAVQHANEKDKRIINVTDFI